MQAGLTARHSSFPVEVEHAGLRLDRFLVERMADLSRAGIQRLIEGASVLVNGAVVKAHHRVRPGDTVEVTVPEPTPPAVLPERIPLDVLYEDDDLLVVNKPAGMIVHPAGRIVSGTLVNALLAHCTALSGIGGVMKPGIVHRLDKGTSGCILYEVIERLGEMTLVRLRPHTGRTHQIRVHMAHLGHPVLGDAVYGRRKSRMVEGHEAVRPMLHAWRLGFTHPRTGEGVAVEAPLPEDVRRVLEILRPAGKGKNR
ncbi:MAG: RluA family pseudouridine synthase [Candidatus Aureabacteria bacterium]|nr:RluA family pseudouridine synthase [Candidatus Auribacterota bacterium]